MATVSPAVRQARDFVDYIKRNPEKTLAEVAEHFGKTEAQVYSGCGLNRALPELQAARERGEFNLDILYIFSILDNDVQREMYPRLAEMELAEWVPIAFARDNEVLATKKAAKATRGK